MDNHLDFHCYISPFVLMHTSRSFHQDSISRSLPSRVVNGFFKAISQVEKFHLLYKSIGSSYGRSQSSLLDYFYYVRGGQDCPNGAPSVHVFLLLETFLS